MLSCMRQCGGRLGQSSAIILNSSRQYARGVNQGYQQTVRAQVTKGRSLKERLLGPTTGKPFVVGQAVAAGGAVVGLGAMCYYGLGLANQPGAFEKSAFWPQYVKDRIHTTYGYLGGSLILTAASAAAVTRSPALMRVMMSNSLLAMFGSLAAVIGTGVLVRSVEYKEGFGPKQLCWMLHTATLGAVLAPMALLGGPLLVKAAVYTAGIVGGLSLVAVCAPSEKFLMMSAPLAMGMGVVFVSTIGTWFLPPTSALGAGLWSIAIYGGLVLFGAFLLYDTQRMIKHAEIAPNVSSRQIDYNQYNMYGVRPYDPINAQISIYLDVLNIFMRLAMIMGGMGNRKK